MKTLIIYFALILGAGVSHAQEVIELQETHLTEDALSSQIVNGNSLSFRVRESYKGEFEKDPLSFMNKHFDIDDFISQVKGKKFHTYVVRFNSSKGELRADFDTKGNLKRSSLRLENILLPYDLCKQLYRDYKGWAMVKNVHIARGKNGHFDKEFYRITMRKGNEQMKLKIPGSAERSSELASK